MNPSRLGENCPLKNEYTRALFENKFVLGTQKPICGDFLKLRALTNTKRLHSVIGKIQTTFASLGLLCLSYQKRCAVCCFCRPVSFLRGIIQQFIRTRRANVYYGHRDPSALKTLKNIEQIFPLEIFQCLLYD